MRSTVPTATVFIDDFASGSLPDVSVVSGEPASYHVEITRNVGALGAPWILLVLLGPIGVVALLIASSARRNDVVGRLPIDEDDLISIGAELVRARRLIASGLAVAAVGGLLLFVASVNVASVVIVAVGLATVLYGCYREIFGRAMWPEVRLDASRRWVTLVGVHPEFAAACERQQRSNRERRQGQSV